MEGLKRFAEVKVIPLDKGLPTKDVQDSGRRIMNCWQGSNKTDFWYLMENRGASMTWLIRQPYVHGSPSVKETIMAGTKVLPKMVVDYPLN